MLWQLIATTDILLEVMVISLSIQLVWNLQTALPKKLTVVSAFSFRIMCAKEYRSVMTRADARTSMALPAVLHVMTYSSRGTAQEHAVQQALSVVWIQVEQHYALISVAIPCLRPVINSLITHYGTQGIENSLQASRYPIPARSSDTFKLSNIRPGPERVRSRLAIDDQFGQRLEILDRTHHQQLRHAAVAYASEATPHRHETDAERLSNDSDNSQRMIIRKHVSWTVSRERPEGQ